MSQPPDASLPADVVLIVEQLDQGTENLRPQLDPIVGDPPARPGLSRVVAAIDRLRTALRLQTGTGNHPYAETFDLPLLRTFVATIGSYSQQPVWVYDDALDLANGIERSVVEQAERLRETAYRPGDPDVERLRDAAEAATNHIRTEKRLADWHPAAGLGRPHSHSGAGSGSEPAELPAAVVPLLDKLDRATEILAAFGTGADAETEDAETEDGDPVGRAGLGRVVTALDRLRAAIRIQRPADGAYPVAETFDVPVLRTLTAVVVDLLERDEWDRVTALQVAEQVESRIWDHTQKLLRPRENNPNRFAELEQLQAAASTAIENISVEQSLLRQREKIQQIASDVQQAAGAVADSELAAAFNRYDEAETRTANAFRFGAIGVLAGVLAFSAYTAIQVPAGLGSALAHVGIGLSGLTAFGYLARESAQHRRVARWAAIMAVQLKTLGAFAADMSPEQREQLRSQFGRRVFSELPEGEVGRAGAEPTPHVQAVVDILQALRPSS